MSNSLKVLSIIGTRPEAIKMAPIVAVEFMCGLETVLRELRPDSVLVSHGKV